MSIRERFSRNERNRKTLERGKAPRHERVAAEVKSRTPVVRKRINPATGRPHRDDPMMHRSRNEGLAQGKRAQERTEQAFREHASRASAWENGPDAYRPRKPPERAARVPLDVVGRPERAQGRTR